MNILIDAGPGSGKTTTLIQGYKHMLTGVCNEISPTQEQNSIFYALKTYFPPVNPSEVVFIAFNTTIKNYMTQFLPPQTPSYTFHGLGQSVIFRKHRYQKLSKNRGEVLLSHLIGKSFSSLPFLKKREYILLLRFISHMKEELLSPSEQSIDFIKEKYGYESAPNDINLMSQLMRMMSVPNKQTSSALENTIEHIDQVWMGLICIKEPLYKIAFVDECQDLSVLRTEFALRIAENIVFCGDGYQSINGFAGADYEVFKKLSRICTYTLPLKTCFRCPPNHIEVANEIRPARIVPYKKENGPIERVTMLQLPQKLKELQEVLQASLQQAAYTYKEFTIPRFKPEHYEEPILIIARTNASLVKLGLHLLKNKIRSSIIRRNDENQDITTLVLTYIKNTKCTSVQSLSETCMKDIAKAETLEFKIGSRLSDIAKCTLQLCKESNSISQIEALLRTLTEESSRTIRLSTIHKAKGLEAPIIFIAFPPVPHPRATSPQEKEQEKNLEFVSETRSMWYKGYIGEE